MDFLFTIANYTPLKLSVNKRFSHGLFFSGCAARIYWGRRPERHNQLHCARRGLGATATNPVLQGTTGVDGLEPVLNSAAFGIPRPFAPGTNGVPPCDASGCDRFENGYASGGRNIFCGPFETVHSDGIAPDVLM